MDRRGKHALRRQRLSRRRAEPDLRHGRLASRRRSGLRNRRERHASLVPRLRREPSLQHHRQPGPRPASRTALRRFRHRQPAAAHRPGHDRLGLGGGGAGPRPPSAWCSSRSRRSSSCRRRCRCAGARPPAPCARCGWSKRSGRATRDLVRARSARRGTAARLRRRPAPPDRDPGAGQGPAAAAELLAIRSTGSRELPDHREARAARRGFAPSARRDRAGRGPRPPERLRARSCSPRTARRWCWSAPGSA